MVGAKELRSWGAKGLSSLPLVLLATSLAICSSAPSPAPAIQLTDAQKEALALRGGSTDAATRPTSLSSRMDHKPNDVGHKPTSTPMSVAKNGNIGTKAAQAPLKAAQAPLKAAQPANGRPAPAKSNGSPPLKSTDQAVSDMKVHTIETEGNNVQKVTELAQKNRLLLQQCKTLRARTTDAKMKKELDSKIAELEAVWQSYIKIDQTVEAPIKIQPPKLEGKEAKMSAAQIANAKRPRVPVTFRVSCELTEVGQTVIVMGGHEEMGEWNPLAALPMDTSNTTWPIWECTVELPAGDLCEYKYAVGVPTDFIKDQYNVVHWEGHMGNRYFKIPRKPFEVLDSYVEPDTDEGNIADHMPPSFVHMHRTDSSECLLDPEYVF